MTALLEVEALSAGYGDLTVLRDVTFQVPADGCLAVLGPNGAGKTTLMKAIAGALPMSNGRIVLDGVDVSGLPPHRRLRQMAWVPEGRMIFPELTVIENIRLSARAAHQLAGFDQALEDSLGLFPALTSRLGDVAGNLSGGQQQMVAMALSLVRRPRILLLDEPTVGLAPRLVGDIRATLERLRAAGLTILIAEQNVSWLHGLVDSVVLLAHGVSRVEAADELLRDRDALRVAYLGD
jgi:branched-chain amino acid transport system ATP-binding protein